MTSKERAYLRSCAQALDPVVSVGKEGLSDGVANALVQALDAHELVKVRFQSAKDEIRERSREAGLFTWNKPAYACLATRIAHGEIITPEKLRKTEEAEDFLHDVNANTTEIAIISINKYFFISFPPNLGIP